LFFHSSRDHRDLPSFPTRRSSDLHMVERALRKKLPVAIDIRRGEHQLFHASLPGTSADNDEWVKRKVRLVNRFGHSSYYMGQMLDRKSTRLNSSHVKISYAVFCLK